MASSGKIQVTKNYDLFVIGHVDNRDVEPAKHRRLRTSMERYGFLKCYPAVCKRDGKGRLVVKDGQHRISIARELGLPVYWMEEETEFSVPEVNATGVPWKPADHAKVHAKRGSRDYQIGIEFAEAHGLPVGTAFALLAGVTAFKSIKDRFYHGSFTIRDRKWADEVAGLYGPLTAMSPEIKRGNARFLEACMAVCSVKGFDAERLLQCAQRCRDKLVSYSTRDAFLAMLEEVYNYGRSKKVSLKFDAVVSMNAKNPAKRGQTNGHISGDE